MSPLSAAASGEEIAAPTEIQDHTHYAGRGVAGVKKPITLAKNGIRQVRQLKRRVQYESFDWRPYQRSFPVLQRFALNRPERRKRFYPLVLPAPSVCQGLNLPRS